jgi:hypothetical protein
MKMMLNDQSVSGHALQTDPIKRRVWVHAPDGSTVGRFDVRFGIDIHNTVTDQLSGKPECLHCTHETPGEGEWALFRDHAKANWNIDIPEDAVDLLPEPVL